VCETAGDVNMNEDEHFCSATVRFCCGAHTVYHTQLYSVWYYCVSHTCAIGCVDRIVSLWKPPLHSTFGFFQHFLRTYICVLLVKLPGPAIYAILIHFLFFSACLQEITTTVANVNRRTTFVISVRLDKAENKLHFSDYSQ